MKNTFFNIIAHLIPFFLLLIAGVTHGQSCSFNPCASTGCGNYNVRFTPTGGPTFCEGESITFENTSSPEFDLFVVDWKDGNVDTFYNLNDITHIYNIPDSQLCESDSIRFFSICFKGEKTCAGGISCQSGGYDFGIIVRPVADFNVNNEVCINTPLVFQNNSCNASNFLWDFGNGNTSTDINPSVEFDNVGTYTVTLTASNSCNVDVYSYNIEVVDNPEANFNAALTSNSSCAPAIYSFVNTSNQWSQTVWNISPADTSKWNFTDTNMNLFSNNIEIEFLEPGIYTVEIEASNICGTDMKEVEIEIFEPLNVNLTEPPPFCNQVTIVPGDLNFSIQGSRDSVHWTFVNGNPEGSDSEDFGSVSFNSSGEIQLEVFGACGDIVSSIDINIIQEEIIFFDPPDSLCEGSSPIYLSADPPGGTWSGSPGITEPDSGKFDPSLAPLGINEITYQIDGGACELDSSFNIFIIQSASGQFTAPTWCIDHGADTLSALPIGGVWNGVGIIDSSVGIFDPSLSGPGSFTIEYRFTDSNACEVMVSDNITVEDLPNLFFRDTTVLCLDSQDIDLESAINYDPQPGGGITSWDGQGVSADGIFNSLQNGLDTGYYTIYFEYQRNDCRVEDSALISLIEKENLFLPTTDTTICNTGGSLQLSAFPTGGTWSGNSVDPNTGIVDLDQLGGGSFTYTYSFQAGTSCALEGVVELELIDLNSSLSVEPEAGICEGGSSYTLPEPQPASGKWAGPALSDSLLGIIDLNQLDPDSIYIYTYCIESQQVQACEACKSLEFTIYPKPKPGFQLPDTICVNEAFSPINNTQDASTFRWRFGDGNESQLKEPDHFYSAEGTYSIQLVATSVNDCIDSVSKDITVVTRPEALFDVSTNSGCEVLEVALMNFTTGNNPNYAWVIGNDTIREQNLNSVSLATSGYDSTYQIQLLASNACGVDMASREVDVFPKPRAEFGVNVLEGCSPLEIQIVNTSIGNPNNYYWDLGNGRTSTDSLPPIQTYTTSDTQITVYVVEMIAENDCGRDTVRKNITVYPPNVEAFIELSRSDFCEADTILPGSYSTPGADIYWELLKGNLPVSGSNERFPKFPLDEEGEYTLILNASNCGTDSDTVEFEVKPGPDIAFSFEKSICEGDSIYFTNLSSNAVAPIWSFGDGDSSNRFEPFHIYDSAGTYQVSLQMEHPGSACTLSISDSVVVIGKPTAEFVPSRNSACPPAVIAFENTSVGQGTLNYIWNFGDGSSAVLSENTSHKFTQTGEFEVALIVYDENLCFSDTFFRSVVIHPLPTSDFSFENKSYCEGIDSINFQNISDNAISFQWTIDSDTFNSSTLNYLPSKAGPLEVVLIAINEFSCADTSRQIINIDKSPKAIFSISPESACVPATIQLNTNKDLADQFYWQFGDGNESNSAVVEHIYAEADTYEITLQAINDNSCPASIAKDTVVVHPKPEAGFSYSFEEDCKVPALVHFSNQSTANSLYNWHFGDGNNSVINSPSHIYNSKGTFNVILQVTNTFGCVDSSIRQINIEELPTALFNITGNTCQEQLVDIENLSSHAYTFLWQLEGGKESNAFEPDWRIDSPGLYDITLIAVANDFCKDTFYMENALQVFINPTAMFDFEEDLDPDLLGDIQFYNQSKKANSYYWDFGDGNFSVEESPYHEYSTNSPFEVILYAYNYNNGLHTCVDSILKRIETERITTFYAPTAMAPEYGPGDVKYFKPVGIGIEEYEISIYSPWGEQVWYSDQIQNGSPLESWDGTYKGEIVPQGAYTWIAKVKYMTGEKSIEKGSVTVLR